MDLAWDVFETPLGWMGAAATSDALRRTTLPQATPERCVPLLGPAADAPARVPERFVALAEKLTRYFTGAPITFDEELIDVDDAAPFLRAAWNACRSIPFGETRTYRWLASQAGSPSASRAAGQSMARNRLPIIVPCHRVIASDGSLGGFGSGASQLDLKRRLLRLEAGARDALGSISRQGQTERPFLAHTPRRQAGSALSDQESRSHGSAPVRAP